MRRYPYHESRKGSETLNKQQPNVRTGAPFLTGEMGIISIRVEMIELL
jgi:hypothetical protein